MNLLDDLKGQYKNGGFEQKLLFWNIGIFIVSLVFFYDFQGRAFNYPDWIALPAQADVVLRRPWTLLTYAFFHANFLHLLFNMLMLFFAARVFLTFFTQRQFLGVYLLGSIFAGLVYVAIYTLLGRLNPIVGASAAIMAVLVAASVYAPSYNIRLALFGRIKLWQITAVLLLIDLMFLLAENTGGHITHLAGACFGFGYILLLKNGTDLSKAVFFIFDGLGKIGGKKKTPFKKVHKNYKRGDSGSVRPSKTASKIVTKDKTQQQIDEILDKISRSGYDSLTRDEKDFLFRAGKNNDE